MKNKQIITKLMTLCLVGAMTFTHTTPVVAFESEVNKSYECDLAECDLLEVEPYFIKTFTTLAAAANYFIGSPNAHKTGTAIWQTANRAVEFVQQSNGLWTAKTATQTIRDLSILNPWG